MKGRRDMREKSGRRRMGGAILAALAAMLLSACGKGGADAGGGSAGSGAGAAEGAQAGGTEDAGQTDRSLKLSICETDEDLYEAAFDEFREKYPEVDLEVETYPFSETLRQQAQQQTQIMAGEGPDLLLFGSYATDDVHKLMKAGAFAALDSFVEADGSWDGGGDYVQAVMDAGVFDGSRYVMPLSFQGMTLLAAQESLDAVGFSMEGCGDTLSVMRQVASIYERGYEDHVLGDVAQFGSYPEMLEGGFLDYKNGKIAVDADTLRQACEAYRPMYAEDQGETTWGDAGYYGIGYDLADGKAYVYMGVNIRETLGAAGALASKAQPVLIPLRNSEGKPLARVAFYAGVRANSENRQNAYNMIRILMGEETQEKFLDNGYCPVNKSVIGQAVDGIIEEDRERQDADIPIGELDEAFIAEFKSCLTDAGCCYFMNNVSINKFTECMEPFYTGEADYDSCMKEFEDYIQIYLTE